MERKKYHTERVPFMIQVRGGGGSTRFFLVEGWNERKRRLLIRIDRTRTNALLLSYVRTAAPEFDLIFPRKEIKRKWPPGDDCSALVLPESH